MDEPIASITSNEFVVAALARSAADLLLVCDADMNILFISDANLPLFGRTPQSALGSNGIEFINPEDLTMFLAMFEAYERGYSSPAPNYYRVLHEDGSWIRMEIAGGPLYAKGERVGWSFVLRRPLAAEVYASVVRRLFDEQPLAVALDGIPETFFAIGIGKVCVSLWPSGEAPFVIGDRLPSILSGRDRRPGSTLERVVQEGVELVVTDLDDLDPELRAAAEAEGFGSVFVAPVFEANDRVAGMIVHWVFDDMPKAEMLRARMDEAKGLIQVALSARFHTDDLRRMASSDTLTGLANRRAFEQALAELTPADQPALVSIDLDGFKEINDAHGHPAGDELLTVTARRLLAATRPDDLVVRIGGDEFVLLLRSCPLDEAIRIAERVIDIVQEPISLGGTAIAVTASLGIAIAVDRVEGWPDDLVRRADDAMYAAKRTGRGRYVVGATGG
jgi:diguanylate cyclase (GGDEF)-like protein/PAS domain S-box-containing protein